MTYVHFFTHFFTHPDKENSIVFFPSDEEKSGDGEIV